jgi:protein TonB
MDRQARLLSWCVGVSLVLHALLLSFHFKFPDALKFSSTQPLEVILVNSKTKEKPSKALALAQANLDGGGNTDQERRAKTPLPVTKASEGKDLADTKRRVAELEAQQQRLLALAKAPVAASETVRPTPADEAVPQPAGRDLRELALAAMKLQAQIDKRHEEYQKRPRKQFIGANASEYRFAQYEEEWRNKVEQVGTNNYPAEARGKIYGNLRLEVTLRPDGNIESIRLERSSGLKVLDEAAFRIVRMAAPYGEFPPDIRKDTDLLIITRTWFFGAGDAVWTKRD